MPRKKRALLMTVGTGTGDKRCSLAHGLMCSIDSKDPDFICFFLPAVTLCGTGSHGPVCRFPHILP